MVFQSSMVASQRFCYTLREHAWATENFVLYCVVFARVYEYSPTSGTNCSRDTIEIS